MEKPKLLVHVCCAPDGLYVIKILQENYYVSGYFYNPNIHPEEEYHLRLQETKKIAEILNFDLIEGEYDLEKWFEMIRGFENEPEKGRRCDICYAIRLNRTAEIAKNENFDIFTTTLTLSPWKKAKKINQIGRMLGKKYKITFLEADFKKKDGFKKSVELSKEFNLYRQNYCGCIYSRRKG
ncbi:epoxyqueuosine reductase QueH [Candidatus Aminicenantes bacterium AC-335-A11]|jgi:predicted adenine nucleotide alpha hydrolase (AANH) superfamily ATPase|nr:epoxyqueuosine reductase QueH [SCandidatus Aminicenantes bacterium Aminicenantia_JdfR_composite]MCP2597788.1 epoxyqueuosine reductase QueH [Candidatus Aminicenantes bacterium AC-335-L06]MCP2618469.1 epoxyqueuosine reductase QueH [Candidatus Aminicenantes bacterium AC-335-A11]MCP2620513.1 epoxyqueuosine reductase QueH [Candidatus Aminicenantes bacterium AC-334-E05]